jgi:predicted kinase
MARLIITVGLPGSGKSHRAKKWVAKDPTRRTRVNRDDCRRMMHGGYLGTGAQEKQVTIGGHAMIQALLRNGVSVVVDDTNLMPAYVDGFRQLAQGCGADFEVWDMTDVDIDVCVARDRVRPEGELVGEAKIRDMWERHLTAKAAAAAGAVQVGAG